MSYRMTFIGNQIDPPEYQSDNEVECGQCGSEFDLDDDTLYEALVPRWKGGKVVKKDGKTVLMHGYICDDCKYQFLDESFSTYLEEHDIFGTIGVIANYPTRESIQGVRDQLMKHVNPGELDFKWEGEYPDTNLFALTIGALDEALANFEDYDYVVEQLNVFLKDGKKEAGIQENQ